MTEGLGKIVKTFKRQPHKMVKPTQTIHRQLPTNWLSVSNHFVRLALKVFMVKKSLNRCLTGC